MADIREIGARQRLIEDKRDVGGLIDILRSDRPISKGARELLASMLEGSDSDLQLVVKEKPGGADKTVMIRAGRAAKVRSLMAQGFNKTAAIAQVAEAEGVSDTTIKKALDSIEL